MKPDMVFRLLSKFQLLIVGTPRGAVETVFSVGEEKVLTCWGDGAAGAVADSFFILEAPPTPNNEKVGLGGEGLFCASCLSEVTAFGLGFCCRLSLSVSNAAW